MGLSAKRIQDHNADYKVSETIIQMIEEAFLLVVDLTDERPNVYFELGYARGKGKNVVTLLKQGSKAHVDVRDWAYIEYPDSRPLEQKLVTRFQLEIDRACERGELR